MLARIFIIVYFMYVNYLIYFKFVIPPILEGTGAA